MTEVFGFTSTNNHYAAMLVDSKTLVSRQQLDRIRESIDPFINCDGYTIRIWVEAEGWRLGDGELRYWQD